MEVLAGIFLLLDILATVLDGVQLGKHHSPQQDVGFLKQVLVAVEELNPHSVEICQVEVQYFYVRPCYDGKRPLNLVSPGDPLFRVYVVVFDANY